MHLLTIQLPSLTSSKDWIHPVQDQVSEMERVNYISCMRLDILHYRKMKTRNFPLNLKLYQCSMWDTGFFEVMNKDFTRGSLPCLEVQSTVVPHIETNCSGTRTAYTIGTLNFNEVECQCDIYCHILNDCCLDINEIDTGYPKQIQSHLALKEENPNLHEITGCISNEIPPLERTHSLGYFMVVDCPHEESHSLLRDHCTQSVMPEELTVFHFIPVEVMFIVYRNVYCAWCHGIPALHESSFWGVKFDSSFNCLKIINKVKKFQNVPFSQLEKDCLTSSNGFFGPIPRSSQEKWNVFLGDTRMGKVCIIPEGVPLAKEVPLYEAESLSESFSPQSLQYHECKRAILNDSKSHEGFNILVTVGGDILSKLNSVCAACSDSALMHLFVNDYGLLDSILIPENKNSLALDGRLSVLFSQGKILNCSAFNVCEKKSQAANHVQIAMSQAGCLFSLASLCTSLHIFKFRGDFCSSEPKRVQFLLILSKIAFFSTFAVGYYFRAIYSICRIVAVVLHFTILISFASSILFGAKVMAMLLRMKYDMAALSMENRDDRKVSWREVVQYFGIWGSILLLVTSFGIYEFALDGDMFGYGCAEICFITKPQALLYALVLPTSVTVGANILTTIISVCLMLLISKNYSGNITLAQSILNFLGRLLAFQSVQWVVGLAYYFSKNEVVGFIFSFLTAFEGVFIYVGVFTSKG